MKALVFEEFGGPDVLSYRDVPNPEPLAGHAIVRTRAIGLNFADVYRRKGTYHLAGSPPFIAGYEAAGEIESIEAAPLAAPVHNGLSVGLRVAFADSPFANAEKVRVPVEKLIPLPDDVSYETAAALLLQGLTAQYLVRDSHPLAAGETALVHAAAGGVGLLLLQMARRLGARAIGLVSNEEKRAAAKEAGAQDVFLNLENWTEHVREATGGRGADVAYDSVGSTLLDTFEAVRTGGHVVFYGMAGGKPPLVDPAMLMDTSKSLTGGDLWNVLTSRSERLSRARSLFVSVSEGSLRVRVAKTFPLADGAAAHAFLESRGSIGKVVMIP